MTTQQSSAILEKTFSEILEESTITDPSFWIQQAKENGIESVLPSLTWRDAVETKEFEGNEDGEIVVSGFKFDYRRMVLSSAGYAPFQPRFDSLLKSATEDVIYRKTTGDDYSVYPGGNGIRIEYNDDMPGCEPHPDVTQCFALSFIPTKFFVTIDLVSKGIDEWVLDYVRPKIRVTQKVSHRKDCSAVLTMTAQLNSKDNVWEEDGVDERICMKMDKSWEQWTDGVWDDWTLEFDDYPSGMRHLNILNEGRDRKFWQGFYGPKIANITIEVILPEVPKITPFEAVDDYSKELETMFKIDDDNE